METTKTCPDCGAEMFPDHIECDVCRGAGEPGIDPKVACRAIKKLLEKEITAISIGEELDSAFGFDAPPYLSGSRKVMETALVQTGITDEEFMEYLSDAAMKEGKANPNSVPWSYHLMCEFEHIVLGEQ